MTSKETRLEALQLEYDKLQQEKNDILDSCQHDWTNPVLESKEKIRAKSEDKVYTWSRKCKECGHIQTTQKFYINPIFD